MPCRVILSCLVFVQKKSKNLKKKLNLGFCNPDRHCSAVCSRLADQLSIGDSIIIRVVRTVYTLHSHVINGLWFCHKIRYFGRKVVLLYTDIVRSDGEHLINLPIYIIYNVFENTWTVCWNFCQWALLVWSNLERRYWRSVVKCGCFRLVGLWFMVRISCLFPYSRSNYICLLFCLHMHFIHVIVI